MGRREGRGEGRGQRARGRKAKGRKPKAETLDIGKIKRLPTEYVPERDAFKVNPADLEPFIKKIEDPDATAQGLTEYAELKVRRGSQLKLNQIK